MSQTLSQTRWNVQQLVGDNNPDRRSVSFVRLNEIVKNNAHSMFSRIIKPRDTVVSVTVSAGTYDYSLSNEVGNVAQIFLNSTGDELAPLPFEILNARYRQDTDNPSASGTPAEYSLWEGVNNATRIRIAPTPSAGGTLKVHRSTIPVFSSPPADADSIPFALDLLRALEMACAADSLAGLSEDELAVLKTDRSAASMWRARADQALRNYNVRASANGYRQQEVIRARTRWAWR